MNKEVSNDFKDKEIGLRNHNSHFFLASFTINIITMSNHYLWTLLSSCFGFGRKTCSLLNIVPFFALQE